MKVLKWMMIVVGVLVAAVAGGSLFLPDHVHVERSIVIERPPATVFALLNGFRRFNEWSPWADLDPKTVYTQEGPAVGPGARFSWASENKDVGSGSQEILESVPGDHVKVRLIFADFDFDNTATYLLAPEGTATKVTWTYDSDFNGDLLGRLFGPMMDSMLGPDYEKGLAKLKPLAESLPAVDLAGFDVTVADAKPIAIASTMGTSTTDSADIARAMTAAYAKINAAMAAASLKEAAPPLEITHKWDPQGKVYEFEAAIPVDRADAVLPDGDVKIGATPGGLTATVKYVGPYAGLSAAYEKLAAWQKATGLESNGDPWEQYLNDPGTVAEAELLTAINQPVK